MHFKVSALILDFLERPLSKLRLVLHQQNEKFIYDNLPKILTNIN